MTGGPREEGGGERGVTESGLGGARVAGETAGTSWWCSGVDLGKMKIFVLGKNGSDFRDVAVRVW